VQTVFITGGTGYIGTRSIKALLDDGNYHIKTVTRKGSENKLPEGCEIIYADALDADTYKNSISPATIFVHLIGVAHPSPAKADQFKKIDLVSVQQAAKAAATAGIKHFIYLSVAMYPTKIMKDYQAVRAEGESILLQQNFVCSFIRPWYVLGPGHWWPLLLKPFYWFAKFIPSKREAAKELSTVTIKQIITTLLFAIKNQPPGNNVYDVAKIKTINF
jgi:nucleoside-diphosphate-sugar epimerase